MAYAGPDSAAHHRSILESGIRNMEIYRAGNRMFMLIEADYSYRLTEHAGRADR